MEEYEIDAYLKGLIDIVQFQSKKLSYSYIKPLCFKKNSFEKEFSKLYKIPKDKIKLKQRKTSLNRILNNWLGKNKNTNTLVKIIKKKLGDEINIYIPIKESNLGYLLAGEGKGYSGMFFIEDLYFIEYNKYIICLLLGNNE